MKIGLLIVETVCLTFGAMASAGTNSVFFPQEVMQGVRQNIQQDPWAKELLGKAIELAEPWKEMSDEQLWKLMFGATLPRSWHVYSNGNLPGVKQAGPDMYDWKAPMQ